MSNISSIREYVERSFTVAPNNMHAVEDELRQIIATKVANNELWTTDWVKMPLPRYLARHYSLRFV